MQPGGKMDVWEDKDKMKTIEGLKLLMESEGFSQDKIKQVLSDPRAETMLRKNQRNINRMSMMVSPTNQQRGGSRPTIVHHMEPIGEVFSHS